MNRNRDIVETRKLASKGRGGDNMIGEIDGAPAHINAYEAYLLDQYGDAGEEAVKDIGSGTINPETGMKEYHYWHTHGPHTWRTRGSKKTTEAKYAARGAMRGGMDVLLQQHEQEMGPEGFITAGQELEEEGIQGAYGTTMEGITQAESQLRSGTNLDYSGEVESKIAGMTEQAQTQYGLQVKESRLKADKAESDFMAGLRKQMNQLMLDYQSVSGEAYSGGSAYNELNTLFENYDNA